MTYKEQLKHPKWQVKRLEIMKRDNFQCQCCLNKEKTLAVHHLSYIKGRKVWEYDNQWLITLCEDCHENLHYHINNNMYDKDILYTLFKCNPVYIDIYKMRLIDFINEKGSYLGLKELIKLISSQIIKKDKI